jgi:hypothetical protein
MCCCLCCLKKENKLSSDINADLLDKKPVFKKKLKDNLDNKDNNTGFNSSISGKQMTINIYNTLIKIFAK